HFHQHSHRHRRVICGRCACESFEYPGVRLYSYVGGRHHWCHLDFVCVASGTPSGHDAPRLAPAITCWVCRRRRSDMRLDQLPRSDKVEDRRGGGPGGFPMGRAGGVGIGTIILLVIVGWALGINPMYLIGGAEILSGLRGSQQESQPAPGNARTESASDQMSEFVSAVLGSTEVQWKEIF